MYISSCFFLTCERNLSFSDSKFSYDKFDKILLVKSISSAPSDFFFFCLEDIVFCSVAPCFLEEDF